jgi:hypothetical protein
MPTGKPRSGRGSGLLFGAAALSLLAGCLPPPSVERDRWIVWFNSLSRSADSLAARMDSGRVEASAELRALLGAAEDSIPWTRPVLGAGRRRLLLAHLIVRSHGNALAASARAEQRRDARLQALGRRADSLWTAGDAAAGRAAWGRLRRTTEALPVERERAGDWSDLGRVDSLLDSVMAAPADSADSAVTPRVSAKDLRELRARLDSAAALRDRLAAETDGRLSAWERRLRALARRGYVERHNELMHEIAAASAVDARGEHRSAAELFARVERRADSLRFAYAADSLLARSAHAPGDSLQHAADADALAELQRIAAENRAAAGHNHAARRYRALSVALAEGRLRRDEGIAGVDSLLHEAALDPELRTLIEGLARDLRAGR